MDIQYLERQDKPRLAYVYTPPGAGGSSKPLVMFCGGFKSNMSGTKATYFEQLCAARGQGYLRFDYTGHGQSDGQFEDGTIGAWFADALDVLDHVNAEKRPVILVGSSMGGWIVLLMALTRAGIIRGVIGIAAAPDFTDFYYEKNLTEAQRQDIERQGRALVENSYDPDDPLIITKTLITEARQHFLLNDTHVIDFPMRLIQGMQDPDVAWETAPKIQKAFTGADVDIVFIEDGDHSLSRPDDLILIDQEIQSLSGYL